MTSCEARFIVWLRVSGLGFRVSSTQFSSDSLITLNPKLETLNSKLEAAQDLLFESGRERALKATACALSDQGGNPLEQKLMVDCRKKGLRFERCGALVQAQAAIKLEAQA